MGGGVFHLSKTEVRLRTDFPHETPRADVWIPLTDGTLVHRPGRHVRDLLGQLQLADDRLVGTGTAEDGPRGLLLGRPLR